MCDESAIALLLDTEKQGFLLEKGRYYIIGHSSASRKSRNYIHLPDESLDAKHCLLEVRSYEEIFIVDLKSATGVHANGRQLQPLIKERVKLNEEFGLGDHLKVQIELIERAAICSLGTVIDYDDQQQVQNNFSGNHSSFTLPEAHFYQSNIDNSMLNPILINDDGEEDCCYVPETQAISEDSDFDVAEFIDISELKVDHCNVSTQEFHDENKMEVSSPLVKGKPIPKDLTMLFEGAKTQKTQVPIVDTSVKPLTEDTFVRGNTSRPGGSSIDSCRELLARTVKRLRERLEVPKVQNNGEGENDQENGLVNLMNEGFGEPLPHIRDSSPRAKRFKTSCEPIDSNLLIPGSIQNSNASNSSIKLEKSASPRQSAKKAANESVASVTNTAIQEEEPTRRLTRARARECEEATRRLTRARARACGLRHSGLADLGRGSGKSVKSNSTTKFSSKRLSL
uniref:FHA domain-containing protein n=1 Tax=Glossina pallidipes TaxID=7398 RepID=A0A1B0A1N7_GLOPL